jgi:hypothetical protein
MMEPLIIYLPILLVYNESGLNKTITLKILTSSKLPPEKPVYYLTPIISPTFIIKAPHTPRFQFLPSVYPPFGPSVCPIGGGP